MIDAKIRPLIDPPLNQLGRYIARKGMTANAVTLAGLGIGILAAVSIALGLYGTGLVLILLSRIADGLDGAVARATQRSDFGGYLDIVCDFLFYGLIPMAFVWSDPSRNAVAGVFLLTSFYFNGASFLGYSILAEKHDMETAARGEKNLYFTGGILEGAETIGFFVILCLWPASFALLAWIFGTLCFVTAASRIALAHRVFTTHQLEQQNPQE